jgi:hypothetical protein
MLFSTSGLSDFSLEKSHLTWEKITEKMINFFDNLRKSEKGESILTTFVVIKKGDCRKIFVSWKYVNKTHRKKAIIQGLISIFDQFDDKIENIGKIKTSIK